MLVLLGRCLLLQRYRQILPHPPPNKASKVPVQARCGYCCDYRRRAVIIVNAVLVIVLIIAVIVYISQEGGSRRFAREVG